MNEQQDSFYSDEYDIERRKLAEWMVRNPQPCVVCRSVDTVGAGTWVADKAHALAVGVTNADRIFAFSLCTTHVDPTEANEKLIMQAIVRLVRSGNGQEA